MYCYSLKYIIHSLGMTTFTNKVLPKVVSDTIFYYLVFPVLWKVISMLENIERGHIMSEKFEIEEAVTLTAEAINRRDFASLDITTDTVFYIADITPGNVSKSTAFNLIDEDGNDGYYVTENDLLAV